MFTNVPLEETIDICLSNLFKNNDRVLNITKSNLEQLLKLAVKESVFVFNESLFKQIDGVAMGSPLGPTLANAFLCYHETRWLEDCPMSFKPIFYRRYVDDCFLLFKEESHIKLFLEYLNSKHGNIRYTVEIENENSLPFLDVAITRDANAFNTGVYKKKTFTGLGLNFLSFVPSVYKINSIKTLINRCFSICSTWHLFHEEIKKLTSFFTNNGYPLTTFNNILKEFLDKKVKTSPKLISVPKDIKYVSLPFYGHCSYLIRNQLLKILNSAYPQVAFRFVFTNPFTIGSIFRHKDRIPKHLVSNIVYSFTCSSCNAGYVGSSIRNLKIRMFEHRGLSFRTSLPLTKPPLSEIRNHCFKYGHSCNENNFRILDKCHDKYSLRSLESIYIYKLKPNLNNYETATKLYTLN